MNATDEWYDVEPYAAGVWRIVEGGLFGQYLVAGEDRALLIDAGAGVGDLRGMVDQLVEVPVTLLLTHGHWDHVGNATQFDDVRADPRAHDDGRIDVGADFYGPADWLADWQAAGRDLPDGVDPDTFEVRPATGVESIGPGAVVDLGGRHLELLATPGHAPGHLAVLDRKAGLLFASDVVHRDHRALLHFAGCDAVEFSHTVDRLVDFRDAGAFDTLMPAHVPLLEGDELEILDSYSDALAGILADDLEYEEVDEGTPARRYEVDGRVVLTKLDVT